MNTNLVTLADVALGVSTKRAREGEAEASQQKKPTTKYDVQLFTTFSFTEFHYFYYCSIEEITAGEYDIICTRIRKAFANKAKSYEELLDLCSRIECEDMLQLSGSKLDFFRRYLDCIL